MENIGKVAATEFLSKIIWCDANERHYRYYGKNADISFTASPILIRDKDKAQNRFYQVEIIFHDNRPNIFRLIKYYFLPQTLQQNLIDMESMYWQREYCVPAQAVKPAPRKGAIRSEAEFLIFFRYEDLVKPTITKSVMRSWHDHFAHSPVPLSIMGFMPHSSATYQLIMDTLSAHKVREGWYEITDEVNDLIVGLNLSTQLD